MKLVLCNGVFEVLHFGHLKMFESAKRMAPMLVVSVTADQFISSKERPLFSQTERAYSVGRCKDVDRVEVCYHATVLPMIKKYQPDIYISGNNDPDGRAAVESYGGKFVMADLIFRIHLKR